MRQVTEQMSAGQSRVTVLASDVVYDPRMGVSRRTTQTVDGVVVGVQTKSGDGHAEKDNHFDAATTKTRSVSNSAGDSVITLKNADNTIREQIFIGNLLTQEVHKDATGAQITATSYQHGVLRRLGSITDGRTGTTTINGYTPAGDILSVTDPGKDDDRPDVP